MNKNDIRKNIIRSLFAQLISLGVGFILNFITPKFINEYSYAYWQTYILYASYVGVLHFGLLDGIFLRYSQYDYDQLDKPLLRSQFKSLLFITGFFSLLVFAYSVVFSTGDNATIFILVALAIIVKNIFSYTSFTFQITNRIAKYSILVITERLLYGLLVLVLLVNGRQDFYLFCIADLSATLVAILVAMPMNRGLYWGKSVPLQLAGLEAHRNIASGVKLMLTNWSIILLMSGSRVVIQWRWDELIFGKVAFAFSLSFLFYHFVYAASIALFPSLKRMLPEELPELYKSVRESLSLVLFVAMLFYFPGCYILTLWLPKYAISLKYVGVILPVIIFASKVSLLTNNYFKAYRKEKEMVVINLGTAIFGFLLYLCCAYVFDSLIAVLFAVVLANMMCSVTSEVCLAKWIDVDLKRDFIIEAAMAGGFILSACFMDRQQGFLLYLCFVVLYIWLYRNVVKTHLKGVFRRIGGET